MTAYKTQFACDVCGQSPARKSNSKLQGNFINVYLCQNHNLKQS